MSSKLSAMKRGFTLTEVLVSVMILAIALLALASLQAWFAKYTSEKFLMLCITNALESAKIQCAIGSPISGNYVCGGYDISISGNCSIPQDANTCATYSVSASYGGRNYSTNIRVCNLQ